MALIHWEPVPARLFTSLFDTPTAGVPATRRFAPATDIVESDTHYILRADLPGVTETDISVELDGNVLSISGSRQAHREQSTDGYRRYERSSGSFRRSVRLPAGVDASAIAASFDRGVLEVTVPKPQAPAPHKITITVGETPRAVDEPAEAAEASATEARPEAIAAE